MKEQIINKIIQVEGGYSNDPADSGGATRYGITEATARAFGYAGSMADMPRNVAYNIYSAKYWDAVRADEMPERVAYEIVDTCVNMGVGRASKFLQRALNVLNVGGKLYPDLTVDGSIGPATVRALKAYLAYRGEEELVKALNCLQGAFYIELAERREKDEAFVYGWLKNRVAL